MATLSAIFTWLKSNVTVILLVTIGTLYLLLQHKTAQLRQSDLENASLKTAAKLKESKVASEIQDKDLENALNDYERALSSDPSLKTRIRS